MALQGEVVGYDLFGEPIIKQKLLRDEYIEPPFSVLDTKNANWVNRKNKWKRLGIRSEIGREAVAIHAGTDDYRSIKNKEGYDNRDNYVSIFDPVLCELMYRWFCPVGGGNFRPIRRRLGTWYCCRLSRLSVYWHRLTQRTSCKQYRASK